MFKQKRLLVLLVLMISILSQLCVVSSADGLADEISSGYVHKVNSYTKDFTGASTFEEVADSNNFVLAGKSAASTYTIASDDINHASHGLYGEINGTGKTTIRQYPRTSGTGIVVVKFDYMFSAFNHSITISPSITGTRAGASSGFPMITMNAAKRLTLGGQSISKVIDVNTWYTFAIVCNFDAKKASLYLNNEHIFTREYETLTSIGNIATIFQPSTACSMYIDNCTSDHYVKSPEITSTDIKSDGTVVIKSNKSIDESSINQQNISIYQGDNEVELASVELVNTNEIVLTPKYPLVSAIEYTVRISSDVKDTDEMNFTSDEYKEVKFITEVAEYDVTGIDISESNEVEAVLVNNSGSNRETIMVVAFKNADGKIISFEFSPTVSIPSDGTPTVVSVQLPKKNEEYCEIFFIESWLNPVTFKNYSYRLEVE